MLTKVFVLTAVLLLFGSLSVDCRPRTLKVDFAKKLFSGSIAIVLESGEGLGCDDEFFCNPPCQNGGTCSANDTCTCPPRWSGPLCNVERNYTLIEADCVQNWPAALDLCSKKSMTLAAIGDKEDLALALEILPPQCVVWVGAIWTGKNYIWAHNHKKVDEYFLKCNGWQPGNRDCLTLSSSGFGAHDCINGGLRHVLCMNG